MLKLFGRTQMKQRLAIIGGNGFIGFNTTHSFDKYYSVSIIDRKPLCESLQSTNNTYLLDIRNKDQLQNTLLEIDPHFVLNLAAQSIVSICLEYPEEAYLDNVLGNLNVLTTCLSLQRRAGSAFRKLIVHTSDKAYGEHPEGELPFREDCSYHSGDIYSTSKAAQDMMTLSWSRCKGLKACVVRSGNIYGPGDLQFSRLIPGNLKRLLQGRRPILYDNSESMVRDFVYIDDLLFAYRLILEKGETAEAYNVGGSGPTRVGDVVKMMKKITGCEGLENKIIHRGFGEFQAQYLDCDKMRKLGWESRISLGDGIAQSVDFYRDYVSRQQAHIR
jgi:CDP-glucose 4,6-dehydratase